MQILARNLHKRLNLLQFLFCIPYFLFLFLLKLNDPSSLRQWLTQITNDEFELKNINTDNKLQIQIKSSIAYTNIVK